MGSTKRLSVSALCAALGLLPVTPVLAWSFGLGSFQVWF
jgi:hypothetical protein